MCAVVEGEQIKVPRHRHQAVGPCPFLVHRALKDLWCSLQGKEVSDVEMLELEMLEQPRVCYRHLRAIPIQQTVESLDMREEGEAWAGQVGEGWAGPLHHGGLDVSGIGS